MTFTSIPFKKGALLLGKQTQPPPEDSLYESIEDELRKSEEPETEEKEGKAERDDIDWLTLGVTLGVVLFSLIALVLAALVIVTYSS